MGYLGCLFAWLHPVRHVSRRVRRAVTPRPIRSALRAKNQIIHPVESAERSVFRAVDRSITPRTPRRKSRQQAPAEVGAESTTGSRAPASGREIDPAHLTIDPLFADAARAISSLPSVSVSWLMQRFDVSYSRAGRIMDQLADQRIISAYVGAKERYVMMPPIQIDELLIALGLIGGTVDPNGDPDRNAD